MFFCYGFERALRSTQPVVLSYRELQQRNVKLTTNLHIVLKLRISVAVLIRTSILRTAKFVYSVHCANLLQLHMFIN